MFVIAERGSGRSEDVEDREEGSSRKRLRGADLPIPLGLRRSCLVNDIVRARAIAERAEKRVLDLYAELENLPNDNDIDYPSVE